MAARRLGLGRSTPGSRRLEGPKVWACLTVAQSVEVIGRVREQIRQRMADS
jgi:hypothetical protein